MRYRQETDKNRQKRKQLIAIRLRRTASRLRKAIKKPKTYEDYKRELRENRNEIELTGSNKTYWRNLTKLIGKEKAAQRRKKAIEQRTKIQCPTNDSIVGEADKKREPKIVFCVMPTVVYVNLILNFIPSLENSFFISPINTGLKLFLMKTLVPT